MKGKDRPEAAPESTTKTTTHTVAHRLDVDSVHRRLHWHHVLVRRRRWSRELDRICARLGG